MKTKLLLLLLLANFSVNAQTNLVPNAGFENWTGGLPQNWTISNSVTSSNDVVERLYSVKLSLIDKTLPPKVITQVPLKANKTYTVKFKYKYLNNNYGGLHPITLNISQNGSASTLSTSTFASNNNWTQKETTFTADSNISYNLSISTLSFDDETFDVLIDDVSVIEGNESVLQYTLIPDINFEKKLIALNIDSGFPDGKVLTKNIESLTDLDISISSINDLTGIEDFVSLKFLNFNYNNVTSVNLSKNINLVTLYCSAVIPHVLKSLDVSNNVLLEALNCSGHNITTLDVSKNILLTVLGCTRSEELLNINLKNGNNKNIKTLLLQNTNLKCVQVDDVNYSNANWSSSKYATTTFSLNCSTLGLENSIFDKVAVYPNPTKGEVNINNIALEKATVYNSLGQLVKTFVLNSGDTNNTINLSGLPKGIYYVYLINEDAASAKKIILE